MSFREDENQDSFQVLKHRCSQCHDLATLHLKELYQIIISEIIISGRGLGNGHKSFKKIDVLEFFYLNRIMCSLSISIFQCPNGSKTAINNLNVKQFPK